MERQATMKPSSSRAPQRWEAGEPGGTVAHLPCLLGGDNETLLAAQASAGETCMYGSAAELTYCTLNLSDLLHIISF